MTEYEKKPSLSYNDQYFKISTIGIGGCVYSFIYSLKSLYTVSFIVVAR